MPFLCPFYALSMPSRGLSKPNLGLSKPTWGLYRRSIEASSGDIRAIVAGVRSFSLQMLAPSRRRACKEFYDADRGFKRNLG